MLYKHMATWNLDQEVVRCGLHQLLDFTLSNDCSRSTVTRYYQDYSQEACVSEGYVEPCNVENGEVHLMPYKKSYLDLPLYRRREFLIMEMCLCKHRFLHRIGLALQTDTMVLV